MSLFAAEIAVRWEGHQWIAYNNGRPTPYSSPDWSTGLGAVEIEDIFELFRHSNLTFLPAAP